MRTRTANRSSTRKGKYRPAKICILRLFIAGASARSRHAVLQVRQLCNAEPAGSCSLEVIDIYQQPHMAHENQIVATPTLIREYPKPNRRFIGRLFDTSGLFGDRDGVPQSKGLQ